MEVSGGNLVLRFERPARCLSYAPYNGGLRDTTCVLNHHVPKNFAGNAQAEVACVIRKLGLPDDTVGFLTAAQVEQYSAHEVMGEGFGVLAVSTVGLSNTRGVGEGRAKQGPSTINTFVVVEQNLCVEGLVNALATAVEAKALAMFLFDVRSRKSGRPAVGTSTDALAVVTLGCGRPVRYAGTATAVGSAIGEAVFECVKKGVLRCLGASPLRRLEDRGVSAKRLFDAARMGVVGSKPKNLRGRFMAELAAWLSDPNVSALLAAAMRLDDEGATGAIESLSGEEYRGDSPKILADEAIGEAIAAYIAGTRGVNNFRHYEKLKPGVVGRLPMFLDDAVCGLLGGVMTRVFDKP